MIVKQKNIRWKIAQAFEIRWWKHYLKDKSRADYHKWKRNYWQQFLTDIGVRLVKKEKVLDVGCGPAGNFMVLDQQEVDAVDPLLNQYDKELTHFDPADYDYVTFHQQAFEDFVTDKQYDKVFCINAINHVADLEMCFDKLIAATKSGGELIVSIDAHNLGVLKQLFRLIPGDILHPHQYDLEEYEQMLIKRGCKIEQTLLYKKERIFNYYIIRSKIRNCT